METIYDEDEKKEAVESINTLFLQESSPLAVSIRTADVQRSNLEVTLDSESISVIKNLIFENLKGAYRRFINTKPYKEYTHAPEDKCVLIREAELSYQTVDDLFL